MENFLKAKQRRENKEIRKAMDSTSSTEATETKPLPRKNKGKAAVEPDSTEVQKRIRSERSMPQADYRRKTGLPGGPN